MEDFESEHGPVRTSDTDAFMLGFFDRISGNGTFGRTWDDDQGLNESYDHGMNLAEALFGL